jgi:CRISPR system Cascade subunit CasD
MNDNTLFIRLAGPMQSWGTSSRFQLRRTDAYPSRSGVLGLLLCAKGCRREESAVELASMEPLLLGVRVDRPGSLDWDYHTAGAKIGMRKAEGGLKHEGNKPNRPFETLLSRRQYLWDASFLVALHGDPALIGDCAMWVNAPAWTMFLGRKCCVPAEPVYAGTGMFESLTDALSSIPWRPRVAAIDGGGGAEVRRLDCYVEHPTGSPPPEGATLVHDVPRGFGYWNHGARFVVRASIAVPVGDPLHPRAASRPWIDPYGPGWDGLRHSAFERDHDLCVFCKAPADEVHHLDYTDVRLETVRSLCKLCHEACTSLEYGNDMHPRRIDPRDPAQRLRILRQIERLLENRRFNRRTELLEASRAHGVAFFDDAPGS